MDRQVRTKAHRELIRANSTDEIRSYYTQKFIESQTIKFLRFWFTVVVRYEDEISYNEMAAKHGKALAAKVIESNIIAADLQSLEEEEHKAAILEKQRAARIKEAEEVEETVYVPPQRDYSRNHNLRINGKFVKKDAL